MKRVPFWKFWNPMSGLFGGLLFGAVILAVVLLLQDVLT